MITAGFHLEIFTEKLSMENVRHSGELLISNVLIYCSTQWSIHCTNNDFS